MKGLYTPHLHITHHTTIHTPRHKRTLLMKKQFVIIRRFHQNGFPALLVRSVTTQLLWKCCVHKKLFVLMFS